jgi:hypothetical protein
MWKRVFGGYGLSAAWGIGKLVRCNLRTLAIFACAQRVFSKFIVCFTSKTEYTLSAGTTVLPQKLKIKGEY